MFDVAEFIAECEAAVAGANGRGRVREILKTAISDPASIIGALGQPRLAGFKALHRSASLTILHIVWPPSFTQVPHNHLLWAEIGVYSGREDNILWRRAASGSKRGIEAVGVASLSAGDCHSFDKDVIHSVTNPLDTVNAGLHIYGGNLAMGAPRSMWNGETLMEAPLDYRRDDEAEAAYNARLED